MCHDFDIIEYCCSFQMTEEARGKRTAIFRKLGMVEQSLGFSYVFFYKHIKHKNIVSEHIDRIQWKLDPQLSQKYERNQFHINITALLTKKLIQDNFIQYIFLSRGMFLEG